jgi:hypothetical protein
VQRVGRDAGAAAITRWAARNAFEEAR